MPHVLGQEVRRRVVKLVIASGCQDAGCAEAAAHLAQGAIGMVLKGLPPPGGAFVECVLCNSKALDQKLATYVVQVGSPVPKVSWPYTNPPGPTVRQPYH